eukprot:Nk52_evm57s266 gene=Nk52_evmTU57s266
MDDLLKLVEDFSVDLFKKLLKINTTNYGTEESGNEIEACRLIKSVLDKEGIPSTIVESKPGRGSIVARLKAENPVAGALLLSAHLDVVPAPEKDWRVHGWAAHPFAGEELDDGYIYGRGTIDMKNMAAMSIAILCAIKRAGLPLKRDLIFAGVADEEAGSHLGASYLVSEHPELIEADIMMTELGGFSVYMEDRLFYPVQVAEKGFVDVRIVAHAPGGHSSIQHSNSAIAKIGVVCDKLAKNRLPMHKCDVAVNFLETIASQLPFLKRMGFYSILRPSLHDWLLDNLLPEDKSRSIASLFHNTCNATVVRGGNKSNVVPTRCEVIVNIRSLPGQSSDDCVEEIKQLIGKDLFRPLKEGEKTPREKQGEAKRESSAVSSMHPSPSNQSDYSYTISIIEEEPSLMQDDTDEEFASILNMLADVLHKRSPQQSGMMVPYLCPGATDAKAYSKHPCRMKCIGFSPVHFDDPEVKYADMFHGTNERIAVAGFLWGLHTLGEAVHRLCCIEEKDK